MSCFPSRHGGIRLPDDEENSVPPLSRDRNAFDLTLWDMVACGNCIPFLRKAEPMGPQLNYYDEEDDYEFEGLLNEQNQDHLPSFLSGNPFGKRGRRRHRTEAEDEGFEGDEEEGEMEADAEHLENDQIDRYTELAGQEYRMQPEDYDLDDEERAAAAQEEIEITRKLHRAQKLAAHKNLAQQDNYIEDEYYPEYEDDNQMTNFTLVRNNDDLNNLPFPTTHIAPVARTIPYVVDGVFELESQENKMPVVEYTTIENTVEVGPTIENPAVVPDFAEPRAEQSSASSTQAKRHGRTSSTIFTAQLEDLTKKLSAIKNNVLASLDDGDESKDERGRKDTDEVSLNEEELEEFTQRAAERSSSRKNSTRPESSHGPITGITDGGGLFSSPVISDDSPFSFFNISTSNSSGSNPPESYRNSEDSDGENILPAPVAKMASAAWSYANKTIQNVNVDDTAQKAAASLQSLQGWLGKAASAAQKAANHVAEEAKTAWAFVGEEGERQRRSRDEGIIPERRRELDGRMRSLTANSLKPTQLQNVAPQLSVSTPTKGGFV